MVLASFLFATMGVCVKLASASYGAGEVMFYRGLTGAVLIFLLARSRGISLRTSATAYLQVAALARAGEPEVRIVFYFSLGGSLFGLLTTPFTGVHAHTWGGAALLLSVGVLATAAQLMMTRAYSTGSALVNASLQ